ncbi:MFS transporter [Corynebacterium heidelbergense]|uniref:MFS transporter n=1 Tax=Corynebacterium heidelbergense TaxID=2055947 RepID=UPI000DD703CB
MLSCRLCPEGRPAASEHGGQQSFVSKITQAPRLLLQDPASRRAFQIIWAAIIFTSIYNVALVFFALDTLRAGGITFAILTQAFLVGRLLGARAASRLGRQHAARVLTTGGIVMGLALLAVGFGRNLPTYIALLFVAGVCNSGQVSALRLIVSSAVPADVRRKAFSTMGSTNSAAMLIGYALGGPVVDCLGAANAFVPSGCGTAALTAVFSPRYLTTNRSSLRFPGHPCSHV